MSLRRRESLPAQRLEAVAAAARPVERAVSEPPTIAWIQAPHDEAMDIDSMYGSMKARMMKKHSSSMTIIKLEPTSSLWMSNKEKYLDGRFFKRMNGVDYIMRSDEKSPIGIITIEGKGFLATSASIVVNTNEDRHIGAMVTYFDADGSNLAVVKLSYHGFKDGGDYVTMELVKVNRENATPEMVKSTLDGDATWAAFALFTLKFYDDGRFDLKDGSLDQVFMRK